MATKQRAKPAPSRSRSGASSRSGSKAKPKGKATRRPRSGPGPWRVLRGAMAGHERDLAGLVLLVVAVVAGLGTYAHSAGVVGEALRDGSASLLGVGRVVVPLLLVWIGVVLVRDRPPVEGQVSEQVRFGLGALFLAAATLGLVHLGAGPDHWGAPVEELHDAGGLVGAALVEPVRAVVGPWAAGALLVAVGLLGLLVVTRSSLRTWAAGAARGARPVQRAARRWVDQVATLASDRRRAEPAGVIDLTATATATDLDLGIDVDALDGELDGELDGLPEVIALAPLSSDELSWGEDLDDVDDEEPDDVGEPGLYDVEAEGALALGIDPDDADADVPAPVAVAPEQLAMPIAWKLPSLGVLVRTDVQEVDRRLVEEAGRTLETALASHGVETRLVGMTVGPQVTRFELELGPGVKVARVTSLHKDIAYAMASADVRILAPIPGRSAIGVEVPNKTRVVVSLGDILTTIEARRASHPLEVGVGRDIAGRPVLVNLSKLPHVLVAGATGAGKSSCINSIVTSLLMRSTPDEVRLILIDPKRVEMGQYKGLPHLLTDVVTNPKKAANALAWAVKEMERRYDLLHEAGFRDIGGYNTSFDRGELQAPAGRDAYVRLPYIVIVVDELNDLMMVAARDVEESITRLAQMARAVGLHLVIATQRPSVNVLTGVIKANVPARMAFAVSSLTDSRVILDQPGAERLIGQGDLLLLGPSSSVAQRIQGAWVTEEEVRQVVGTWRRQVTELSYEHGVEGDDDQGQLGLGLGGFGGGSHGSGDDDDDEVLVLQAMDLVVRSQLGSTSMLQRKLRVGFARAGRIMDLLEQRGIVGPSEGSKARAVLMTVEELDGIQQAAGR